MLSRLCEGSCELVTTELKSLKIDRVDLVPEGADSAAFVTLYKGKEMKNVDADEIIAKMKPEHAEVIKAKMAALQTAADEAIVKADEAKAEADEAKAEAEEANKKAADAEAEAEKAKAECKKADETINEGNTSMDEVNTLEKSLEGCDPAVKEYIERLNKQKEAAETVAKEALAKEKRAEAEARAESLKALPIEKSRLVDFIEQSDADTVDMLDAIAKGIEGTVLTEVGKSYDGGQSFNGDAWAKIETEAATIAKERGITTEAATAVVLSEKPELYKEYLQGGAN